MSLHNNAITGTVPTFVGSMQHLSSLWLQENQFQGNVPSELGKCANLTDLYLDGNFFRGSPPSSLGNLHNLGKDSRLGSSTVPLPIVTNNFVLVVLG